MNHYNFYRFPFFDSWLGFSGSIPSIYWQIESEEQRYHWLCKRLQKLVEYASQLGIQLNLQGDAIEELYEIFEEFKEHGFDDYYRAQIEQWVKDHLPELWDMFAAQVFFGLTDDGFFCAYVPQSWDDIMFDTGMVYGKFDYGRLILRYDVDNARGVIDNTGRYDDGNTEGILARLIELERRVFRNENTLYTELNG